MTTRPRLSDRVVFTVDAPRADVLAGRDVRPVGRPRVDAVASPTRQPLAPRRRHGRGHARARRRSARAQRPDDAPDVPHGGAVLQRRVRGAEPGRRSRPTSVLGGAPTARVVGVRRLRARAPSYTVTSRSALPTAAIAARVRRPTGSDRRCERSTRERPADDRTGADRWPARDHAPARRPPTTRSARSKRGSRTHVKYSLNAPLAPRRRRRRRRLPVPHARRMVRTGREQPRGDGPQRRDPGAARDRVRARHARRADRPVRRAGARRARVGRDLLPRRRLAAVRPDRVGAACRRRDGEWLVVAVGARHHALEFGLLAAMLGAGRARRSRSSRPRSAVVPRAGGASWARADSHRLERIGRPGRAAARAGRNAARVRGGAGAFGSATNVCARSATRSTPTGSRPPGTSASARADADVGANPRSDREGDPVRSPRRRSMHVATQRPVKTA